KVTNSLGRNSHICFKSSIIKRFERLAHHLGVFHGVVTKHLRPHHGCRRQLTLARKLTSEKLTEVIVKQCFNKPLKVTWSIRYMAIKPWHTTLKRHLNS
ncbi:hypothetical protein, partial [Endozoicomonas sp. SESOKO3]|uniref:hypothetical protein n=1 Tax=Endozoicomonas sp. SESOKO3 TaxID=2828744 RepID=UPI002147AA69